MWGKCDAKKRPIYCGAVSMRGLTKDYTQKGIL